VPDPAADPKPLKFTKMAHDRVTLVNLSSIHRMQPRCVSLGYLPRSVAAGAPAAAARLGSSFGST
jgi:hypothetical protein